MVDERRSKNLGQDRTDFGWMRMSAVRGGIADERQTEKHYLLNLHF